MSEALTFIPDADMEVRQENVAPTVGRVTVLEALATEASNTISPDMSRRSTQMGNGVDAEDD